MIDSSGTVVFDLEKVRAVLEEAIDRMSLTVSDEDGFVWEADPEQTAILQEILDRIGRYTNNDYLDLQYQLDSAEAEIERLRADYDKLKSSLLVIDGCKKLMNRAARIDELEADNQNLVTLNKSLMNNDWILRDNNRKYRKRAQKAELLNKELKADLEQSERVVEARLEVIDQQAAKIRELESSLDEAEALTKKNADLMNIYLTRIAELEDALVEGLTNFLHYRASCYDPARRCPYAKECDDCSTWDACGHVEKFRSEARQRLQAEGKIGPDAMPSRNPGRSRRSGRRQ